MNQNPVAIQELMERVAGTYLVNKDGSLELVPGSVTYDPAWDRSAPSQEPQPEPANPQEDKE